MLLKDAHMLHYLDCHVPHREYKDYNREATTARIKREVRQNETKGREACSEVDGETISKLAPFSRWLAAIRLPRDIRGRG